MSIPTLVLQITGGSKEHISSIDPQQPGWMEVHGQYFEDRRRLAAQVINCCNSYDSNQRTIAELRACLSDLLNVSELNLDDADPMTVVEIRRATELLERTK